MRRLTSLSILSLALIAVSGNNPARMAGAFEDKPSANLQPVTIEVVDVDTGKPIPQFRYRCRIETPDGKGDVREEKYQDHSSTQGPIKRNAPVSCELTIYVKAQEYEGGYGSISRTLHVKSDDNDRKFVATFKRGITVRGTVRDARTKQPVQDARVMGHIYTPPMFSPDEERAVRTDAKGNFTLPGVIAMHGIRVRHANYFESYANTSDNNFGFDDKRKDIDGIVIELEAGETLTGTVTMKNGQPVPGVRIVDGYLKEAMTDKDGKFVLHSPTKWWNNGTGYRLDLCKEGFLEQTLHPTGAVPGGMQVVMEPLYELRGRVLTPDGKPVEVFTVMAGPGRMPGNWQCAKAAGAKGTAGFRLRLKETGTHWIGVRAPGFAVWEGWTEVKRDQDALTITLQPGVAVTGKVKLPPGATGPVRATLTPQRREKGELTREETPVVEMATLHTDVNSDGTFAFPHVRPDHYLLTITGTGVTRREKPLQVTPAGVDLGSIELKGTGRIVGQAFNPPREFAQGAWAFADGEIYDSSQDRRICKPITFKADEQGRFQVEDVPAGEVEVIIRFWASADILSGYVRTVHVVPGQTTQVQFFDPEHQHDLTLDVVIGNGSLEHFRSGTGKSAGRIIDLRVNRPPCFQLELASTSGKPASYPNGGAYELEGEVPARIVMLDVSPGKYRLTVVDDSTWGGIYNELFTTEFEAGPGKPPVRVPLGAGSVTGQLEGVEVRSWPCVFAISANGTSRRMVRCENNGDFCLPYLTEGRWIIYGHDNSGWCQFGEITVKNDTQDLGSRKLQPGGTLTVHVAPDPAGCLPDMIVATDAHGIKDVLYSHSGNEQNEFTFEHLWPGRWTVEMRRGQTVLATTTVEVKGTETVRCKMAMP